MSNGMNLTTKQRLVRRIGFVTISCTALLLTAVFGIAAMRKAQAEQTMPLTPKNSLTTDDELWQDVNRQSLPSIEAVSSTFTPSARTLRLNQSLLAQTIAKAPLESQGNTNETTHETILPLPLPDGSFAQFRLENSPVLPPSLASQFPEIQSYRGEGIGIAATMRCDWTPRGFHATIFLGDQLINIQPISLGDTQHYASYYNHAQRNEAEQFFCQVKDELPKNESSLPSDTAALNYGGTRRTYRIAIATTVEYTNAPSLGGGSVASTIASLNTFLNAVNVVYERELTIRFVLAAGNDNAVYTAEPDPFTNGDASQMLSAVTAALKDKVGTANYDLGHVLGTGGGGVASLAVACGGDSKSRGVSLILTGEPVGTGFSLQTLMHEIGHQFGATHTFSALCSGNRTDQTAFESASGLTIMSYGGTVCTPIIVGSASPHFHSASIQQIQEFVASDTTCAQRLTVSNTAPTLNPGIAFTIPKQTPYALTATGADADAGDFQNFTYTWEQMDAGPTPPFISATGPLFRPFVPTSNPVRIFPSLTYILNNANVPPATIGSLETAENLPDAARTMNFNSVVRDNRGGVAIEPVAITVASSGPFVVTQPNTAVTWTGGSTQTVTWNVNGTNAVPVNCQTVRITLSVDGGNTFPYVLSNNAPNSGSADVTIPLGLFSSQARIKVEAIGNIFFDISDTNFNLMPGDGCPAISSLTPLIGTSGTPVTITGTGFTGVTSVVFGGGANATFTVNSDTQITATVPSAATSGFININKGSCGDRQTNSFTVATGPTFTRRVDDNSIESTLALGGTNPVYWVNRISPETYPATVRGITFFIPPTVPIGTNLTMLVGSNPSGGSSLNGTTYQTLNYTTVSNNQFVTVFVPNVTITSGDAVVGFIHVSQSGVFPVAIDQTAPIQNRSYYSANAGASYALLTDSNLVIRAVFSPGAICSSNCTPPSGNTPPNSIPGAALTRAQGTLTGVTQIATISDAQTNAGSLTITPTVIPDGVTITNLTNTNGVVTAQVQAACSATTGLKVATFTVSDGELNTTMNLLVNVPANPPPTLGSYANTSIGAGASTTLTPSAAPKDNGSITSLTVASPTFTGSLFINGITGNITVNNAGLSGAHTVTVTATDNCGGVSTTSFQLTVVTPLTISSLSPSVIQAKSAGFNLVVNGTGFSNTSIVSWNGTNRTTTFNSVSQLTAAIPATDINLDAAGSANITVFDPATNLTSNTVAFTINAPNPAPTLSTLNPTTATAGGAAFTLTVTGTNFINASQINFNGNARTTTFVSSTQLTASIAAADIANAGTAAITVVNPSPGGGTSNGINLPINNPAPGTLTLNPASILVGSSPPTVTVTGTNFRSNSIARVNGADRATMFVSATELKATLIAAEVANAAVLKLTVFTPTPGGGTSPEADFTVNNPAPVLSSINPSSAIVGSGTTTVTLTGTSFRTNSVVRVNGADRTTTFVSATQLRVDLTTSDLAAAATIKLRVFTPTPGGGLSSESDFVVGNPTPAITTLAPASVTAGSAPFTLTINGNGFVTGSRVKFNGTDRSTTFISSTQLTIDVAAIDVAVPVPASLSVFNLAPGGGTSNTVILSINNAGLGAITLNPNETLVGSGPLTLSALGNNFASNYVIRVNGVSRPSTFVSSSWLTTQLTLTDLANAGTLKITVYDSCGGESPEAIFTINNPAPALTTLNPASVLTSGGAFTLTINGTGFIVGSQVKVNGADRATTVVNATQLTINITAAEIANAGSLAIMVVNPTPGGGTSNQLTLPINNPAPVLTTINPSTAIVGSAATTVTLSGTGFRSNSIVRVNGVDRATNFVSETQMTTQLTVADLANAGSLNVSVNTPAPGGGTSAPLPFTINNPAPSLANVNPTSAFAGGAAFTLTINGTGFTSTSQARVNTVNRATAFVSATQLTIDITVADIANTGTLAIDVVNPSPGGGATSSINLPINNPVPGALTLAPNAINVGSGATMVTVTGTNFRTSSVVQVNNANRTTTFVSATELKASLPNTDFAAAGVLKLKVVTPAPGGGTSPEADLAVNNPAPTLTSLNPATATKGGTAFTLTVGGTGFINGSVVRWNGAARATTFVSATQLTASILDTDIANEGSASITVINPTPGGGTSNAINFLILPIGFESDVAPRPNGSGNGTVTIADWTQIGRFVAALDIAANGTEFQRADVAPKDSKGDGRITIADWVQAGRYAAGLDPVVGIGGPTQPIASITNGHNLEAGTRLVRAVNNAWTRGQINSLQIELESNGNENAFGFSLEFDPKLMQFYRASASNGATLTINSQFITQGRIGLIVALPAGQQFVAGTRSVLQLQFIPNGGADNLTTAIRFSDSVVKCEFADSLANTLTGTTFANANITITGQSTAHVSAASYAMNDAAADSIISAFGTDLATTTEVATSTPLPSLLGGTRVVVRDSVGIDRVAPLFFVSPTQINYLIPTDTADGLATITISNSRGTISRGIVNINRTAPGLFTADATGRGFAAATLQRNRSDGSTSYEPVTRFDQSRGQIVAVPIEFKAGDELFLAVYGTGLRYRNNLNSVKARIGGVETEVLYAGAQGQYIGLDQINLRIPPAIRGRGEVAIEIEIDGNLTNPVKIFIQ